MSFLDGVNPEELKSPFDNSFLSKRPRPSVYRWLINGDLKAIRMGGRWYTTDNWVREYLEASTNNSVQNRNPAKKADLRNRAAEVEDAEKKWQTIQEKKTSNSKKANN